MNRPNSNPGDKKDVAADEAVPSEDELEQIRTILDRTRCIILQQIVAADSGVLCRAELEARNPDVNQSTLQYHIDTLVKQDILRKLEANENQRDLPSVFFGVSERGVEVLKRVNLYDEIAVWSQVYSQVPTPDDLKKIENMERPESEWSG